jgi:hypothetical protein
MELRLARVVLLGRVIGWFTVLSGTVEPHRFSLNRTNIGILPFP